MAGQYANKGSIFQTKLIFYTEVGWNALMTILVWEWLNKSFLIYTVKNQQLV